MTRLQQLSVMLVFVLVVCSMFVTSVSPWSKGHSRRYRYYWRCWLLKNFRKQYQTKFTTVAAETSSQKVATTLLTRPETTPGDSTMSSKVRQQYELTQMITNPKLYGFSRTEANSFPSRMNVIPSSNGHCKKNLTKRTKTKIEELEEIFKSNHCNGTGGETQHNGSNNHTGGWGVNSPLTSGMRIANHDGSITTVRECIRRGAIRDNNLLQTCTECHAVTMLPNHVFPQFLNEVICLPTDNTCLSSSGNCIETSLFLPFRNDTLNVGVQRLGEWQIIQQSIRTSCSCELPSNSVFTIFI